MTTLINALIRFLCRHCRVMYLDTFYQVCDTFSGESDPYGRKPFYYAKSWAIQKGASLTDPEKTCVNTAIQRER